jgi:RNA repair pathway DNA polymerase beta family protein
MSPEPLTRCSYPANTGQVLVARGQTLGLRSRMTIPSGGRHGSEDSGPGDLDLTVYSLRKWMRLALAGNPTVRLPLFVPDEEIVAIDGIGRELRSRSDMILSRQAGHRFAGYLRKQREGLLSLDGKGRDVTRPELVEAFGFDTKFAGHMVRLGLQGSEHRQHNEDRRRTAAYCGAIGGRSAGSVTTRMGVPARYAATSCAMRCQAVRKSRSVT